jgi:hypothetical protein
LAYLSLALFAEGPTDHRFLSPLLYRLAEEICLRQARGVVDVGRLLSLRSPESLRDADRPTRIVEAARQADSTFHVLFLHTDGGSDWNRAYAERVAPAVAAVAGALSPAGHRTTAVVPVRETEAWALADGDALRSAFGTTLSDEALGVPERPADVEGIPDAKKALEHALVQATGPGRRRRRRGAAAFLEVIGEQVSLARLAQVPAFGRLAVDLQRTLEIHGFIAAG